MAGDILRMRYGVIVVLLLMLVISGYSVAFVQEKKDRRSIILTLCFLSVSQRECFSGEKNAFEE